MQIEQVIMTFADVGQSYLILLENDGLGDVMRVQIEIRDEHFVEDMRVLQNLQKAIAARLRDEIEDQTYPEPVASQQPATPVPVETETTDSISVEVIDSLR